MKANNDPVLSASMLASRWGVTSRTVTDLAKKGIAIRAPAGGYYERASTLAYIGSLRKTAAGRSGITDERLQLIREQRDKLRLENAATRGETVKLVEVIRVWSDTFREVSVKMLAISDRLATRLPHLSRHDLHEIDHEIRIVLTETAEGYDPKRDHGTPTTITRKNDDGEKAKKD